MASTNECVENLRKHYPQGTKLLLDEMRNDPRPIKPGTKGEVQHVDDAGTIHCVFEDGRVLGIIPWEDKFHIAEKYVLWSNINLNYEDWKAALDAAHPTYTEDMKHQEMYELNNSYLEDEKENLEVYVGKILVIGDLGLWNGRHHGYKEVKSGMISDCFDKIGDYAEWYVDEDDEFRCDDIHHDGTNHYIYRAYLPDAEDEDIEDLEAKIFDGTATTADYDKVTRKLGPDIAKVYGW